VLLQILECETLVVRRNEQKGSCETTILRLTNERSE